MANEQEPTYVIELYERSGRNRWQGILRGAAPGRPILAEVYTPTVHLAMDMLYEALAEEGVDAPGPGD